MRCRSRSSHRCTPRAAGPDPPRVAALAPPALPAPHLLLQLQRGEGAVRRQQRGVQPRGHGVAAAGVARDQGERAGVRHKVLPEVGGYLHDVLFGQGGAADCGLLLRCGATWESGTATANRKTPCRVE